MSYSQNSSESKSDRGLNWPERNVFSAQAPAVFGKAQEAAYGAQADPGGLSYMPVVDKLLPVGRYGTAASGDAGIQQLGRENFSRASSSRAQRGFSTAPNLESVIGDSLRMSAPQLIPLAQSYALERAKMAPQLQSAAVGYSQTPLQALTNLINGTGSSSASGSGFGFDASQLIAAAAAASDRRLKSNIVRLGTHPLGIGWYEYDIAGKREQGVMAQELLEVMPEAVTVMDNGYFGVYYDKIGRM